MVSGKPRQSPIGIKAFGLVDCCVPATSRPMVRFALATGCRAREITGLEWSRVDLERRTAWLNRTKNGTPRGVPLNRDAVAVLEEQLRKHPRYCFTYRGKPIRWELTNSAWQRAIAKAGIEDFRFHDLRHYLGVVAPAGWYQLRRVGGPRRLEVAGDGGPVREVCDGTSGRCGFSHRERSWRKRDSARHEFPTVEREKG